MIEAESPFVHGLGAAKLVGLAGLSQSDHDQWRTEGYVLLPGVLGREEIRELRGAVEEMTSSASSAPRHPSFTDTRDHLIRVRNAVGEDPRFARLIDHERTLGPLVELMGEHLLLIGSEAFVRGYTESMSEGFHTDGGLALQSVRVSDESITVQLKVQFFLTDVLGTDAGNFILVPGSHERRIPSTDERCFLTGIDEERKNAIQVRARAGDAVIFPWNLWHGAAPNLGASKRLSVILRYGQLWCRPIDYTSMEQHRDVLSARQRRLVGLFDDPSHPADYYKPQRQRETLCGPDSGSE